jgi:hypothetical protein
MLKFSQISNMVNSNSNSLQKKKKKHYLGSSFIHPTSVARNSGMCLKSQLLKRLKQKDYLSSGVWGQPECHNGTQTLIIITTTTTMKRRKRKRK